MPTSPLPPPGTGLTWRPASLDDAGALAALTAAADAVEDLEEVLGPDGARHYLTFPGLDPEHDTLLGLAADGSARAFAWAWVQEGGKENRAILWIETHPEHTGVEAFLLAWAEARATNRMAEAPAGRRRLRLHVEEHRHRRRGVIEAAGYRHARTFFEMHRPLPAGLGEPAPPPPGVIVVPWSPDLDDAARQAANEAFSMHWDSLAVTSEHWRQRVTGDSTFRPNLSFLATANGEVVALCLAASDPEHNERTGVEEMWIERVGTRPAFQRHGLGATLLLHALRAGAGAGMTRAGLTVDAESTTRASALYERLGFLTARRTLAYVKDLG